VQGIAAGLALRLEVIDRAALGGFYKWSLARFLSYLGVPLGARALFFFAARFAVVALCVLSFGRASSKVFELADSSNLDISHPVAHKQI
jgi:hypothetical protein